MEGNGYNDLLCAIVGKPLYGLYPYILDEQGNQVSLKQAIDRLLQNLAAENQLREQPIDWKKHQEVLVLRFGLLNGKQQTLAEVGTEFGCSGERIRQMEKRVLLLLRNPTRSRLLRLFLVPSPEDVAQRNT